MRILDTYTPFAFILREANMVKPSVMAHLDPTNDGAIRLKLGQFSEWKGVYLSRVDLSKRALISASVLSHGSRREPHSDMSLDPRQFAELVERRR